MALFLRFYFFIFMFACLPSCNYETFAYGGSDVKSTLGIQWQAPVERENGEQLFAYEIGWTIMVGDVEVGAGGYLDETSFLVGTGVETAGCTDANAKLKEQRRRFVFMVPMAEPRCSINS